MNNTTQTVKILKKGIRVDGKYYAARFEHCQYGLGTEKSPTREAVIIRGKDGRSLPKIDGVKVENNTDIMIDYFETDKIELNPDHFMFAAALASC